MSPLKRIAFISGMAADPWGGSELLWTQAAKHLLATGNEVFAAVKGWAETPEPLLALISAGAILHERYENFPVAGDKTVSRLTKYWRRMGAGKQTWHQLRKFQPDLVCISHGATYCGLDWMLRCHRDGIPYVSIAQANAEHWWPDDPTADLLVTAYLAARSSFFVSKSNLRLFEAQIGVRLADASVVHNPFQVPFDSNPPWPVDTGEWRLACVGRLDAAAKGQDLILELLSQEPWLSRNISVSFCGTGKNSRSLKRYATALGVTQKIRFCGHVPDVSAIWEEHHALLLPSRFEGLALAVVEAMLSGRIPIVTNVAGNSEIVTDGVTGFIAPAPTLPLLAQTLEQAWERRETWQQMGAKAGEMIRQIIPPQPAAIFAEKLLRLASFKNSPP